MLSALALLVMCAGELLHQVISNLAVPLLPGPANLDQHTCGAIRRGRGDWECTAVQRVQAGRAAAERGERGGKRSYAAVCSTSDRLCVWLARGFTPLPWSFLKGLGCVVCVCFECLSLFTLFVRQNVSGTWVSDRLYL
jgi:hypothetical protein